MRITKAITAPFRAAGAGLKALSMRWSGPGWSWGTWLLPRTRYDYAKTIGDGSTSSIVVACVNWIARAFPEAPVMVVEEQEDGTEKRVARHEMVRLLERPNPEYSGVLMWMATLVDWVTDGNGYWLKVRDRRSKVAQLWWAPSWTMEPKWPDDGQTFISHYEYKPDPGRDPLRIPPTEVVHFRYGMDPRNTRKGLSQLRSLFRELFTDEEAANLTASLMRNLGVPGVVISPDGFNAPNKEAAEEIKNEFMQKFGGDRRGEPMVMTAPSKIHTLAFSPEQMNLRMLRQVPEERASAVLGIPAMVVGFGAGLEHSSFTNYETALAAAWNQNIVPTQRLMAADLEIQLLPDFETEPRFDVTFDLTKVKALQPDQDKLFARAGQAIREGWFTIADGKRYVGLPTKPEEEYYLRQFQVIPILREAGSVVPPTTVLRPDVAAPALADDGTVAPKQNGHVESWVMAEALKEADGG